MAVADLPQHFSLMGMTYVLIAPQQEQRAIAFKDWHKKTFIYFVTESSKLVSAQTNPMIGHTEDWVIWDCDIRCDMAARSLAGAIGLLTSSTPFLRRWARSSGVRLLLTTSAGMVRP